MLNESSRNLQEGRAGVGVRIGGIRWQKHQKREKTKCFPLWPRFAWPARPARLAGSPGPAPAASSRTPCFIGRVGRENWRRSQLPDKQIEAPSAGTWSPICGAVRSVVGRALSRIGEWGSLPGWGKWTLKTRCFSGQACLLPAWAAPSPGLFNRSWSHDTRQESTLKIKRT